MVTVHLVGEQVSNSTVIITCNKTLYVEAVGLVSKLSLA